MKYYCIFYKRLCKLALLLLPVYTFSQNITFSEPLRDDTRNINFEVMGKIGADIFVFKNLKNSYAINIYDAEMQLKDNRLLSFLPDNTFNVDYITFADSFCLVYQYKKKGVVYCMAAKFNADGKLMYDPVELNSTKIDWLSNSKIYTTINSDDKKKIMIFKIQRKGNRYNVETFLFDNNFKPIHQSEQSIAFNDKVDMLSDFFVDNDGNFVFAKASKENSRSDINKIELIIKPAMVDSFQVKNISLNNYYVDEVSLKVDNANKHYLINSLYYNERNGNIAGVYSNTWDRNADSSSINTFIPLNDSLRSNASTEVKAKLAFDNYYIRNVIVKKDGGYLLTAEDYSTRANGSNDPWNRWDYPFGNPYTMNYYNYNPAYGWYYRPYDPYYNNQQSTRYYYNNVLVLNVDKNGNPEWGGIIQKNQYADDDDNYLSFLTYNINGQIHFLFNDVSRRNMLVSDNTFTSDGTFNRNPPLKTLDNGYQFMPKFGKQVGARRVIVPCVYRNSICFAKIDY